jgi:hypothetical protein
MREDVRRLGIVNLEHIRCKVGGKVEPGPEERYDV